MRKFIIGALTFASLFSIAAPCFSASAASGHEYTFEVAGFDVCVQRSWQMLTGESPVVVKVGQPLSQ